MRKISLFLLLVGLFSYQGKAQKKKFEHIPGTVVHHYSASQKTYFGSPSLVRLPNGDYLASYDIFGAATRHSHQGDTGIFCSKDQGKTWKKISEIYGAVWSSLFVHHGVLYLLGPDRPHGTIMIRKSSDGGKTWTQPTNKENGVLLTGAFHCAPMPIVEHNGRLWRPVETAHGPNMHWGKRYGAMVMSAPMDADLLKSKSWQTTNALLFDSTYLDNKFGGWMEGNFVVDKQGKMWNFLRVHNLKTNGPEYAGMVSISPDGKAISFDRETGFIPFEGGSKKFKIDYDPVSEHYWTLANPVLPQYRKQFPYRSAFAFRNVLALYKSKDLKKWERVKIILEHEDVLKHAFQYADWLFEDNNIVFLSRTAHFDGKEEAKNHHDANFITFHRIENFRDL